MSETTTQHESTSLFKSLPKRVEDWVNSEDVLISLQVAMDAASKTIADLNKERQVKREDLQQPIMF